jgi:hypothetical protein
MSKLTNASRAAQCAGQIGGSSNRSAREGGMSHGNHQLAGDRLIFDYQDVHGALRPKQGHSHPSHDKAHGDNGNENQTDRFHGCRPSACRFGHLKAPVGISVILK